MGFELIPAIDLLGGRCVRLRQGRYDDATVYADDPAAVARRWRRLGARRLHLVDLDGARAGRPVNGEAIRAIVAAFAGPVQLGGGLRTIEAIEAAFALGISRAILGSAAVEDPALVEAACRRFPGRIVVGIDARGGRVAVRGWEQESTMEAEALARRLAGAGVAALIHTDIARDGMLAGPNLAASARIAEASGLPVIVSGGIASLDDVLAAARMAPRGIAGAITGRAIYEGALDLAEAYRRLAEIGAC